ncbi:alpha-mannosidase [Echinicola sediminis]
MHFNNVIKQLKDQKPLGGIRKQENNTFTNLLKISLRSLILLFGLQLSSFAQEAKFHYYSPIDYKKTGNQVLAKAKIFIPDELGKTEIILDGIPLKTEVYSKDTLSVWVPLIGKSSTLTINSKGKKQTKAIFEPIIPSDWGYFQNGTVHIIVSSHQDIAWMNTPEYCREERIHDIILPALDTMNLHNDYRFEMEQTLNLIELLEEYPEKKETVKEAYKNGQFEWGATFNQPYEGIESGEQLVRQMYWGRKWIKDNIPGMDAHTAYNVDVPGRSLQFPQILSKGGIKNLVISRFGEGFYNWYSPDGSKIFTYSPGNYGWAVIFYKYFDQQAPLAMNSLNKQLKNWDEYYEKRNIPPHYGVMISQDAAGPIYYREVVKEWNNIVKLSEIPLPKLRHSTADEFLKEVNVPEAKFDSIQGERPNIWMYIHGPGHYQAIKAKRKASVSLPAAEIFSTFAGLVDNNMNSYPKNDFDEAWFNAIFPDHGWGGLNGGVTDSTFQAKLTQAHEEGEKLLHTALSKITANIKTKKPNGKVVFNDLNWSRDELSTINLPEGDSNYIILDENGQTVPSQKEDNQLHFIAKEVPSVGFKTFYLEKSKKKSPTPSESGVNYFENKYYKITLGNGGLKSLFDKELNQEVLNTTRYAGGDVLALGYDGNGAGEFVEMAKTNMRDYSKLSDMESHWKTVSSGPVFTVFEASYSLNDIEIIQSIKVFNDIKKIDFEYTIPNWDGRHNRQWRFALGINEQHANISYESPMGMVTVGEDELPISPGGWSWEGTYRQLGEYVHPREVLDFMTASGDDLGVTLSSTVSVVDWIDPVRDAVSYPVLQGIMLSTHKSCHGMGPFYEQKGKHTFKFSISSHQPGWKNGYQFGKGSQHPFYTLSKNVQDQSGKLPSVMSFMETDSPFTAISTIKKSDYDDDIILRLVNMQEKAKKEGIRLSGKVVKAERTNLVEEYSGKVNISGSSFSVPLQKNAVETYKLKVQY